MPLLRPVAGRRLLHSDVSYLLGRGQVEGTGMFFVPELHWEPWIITLHDERIDFLIVLRWRRNRRKSVLDCRDEFNVGVCHGFIVFEVERHTLDTIRQSG